MTNSNHFLYINIKYIHRSGSIVEWREKCHEFSGYRSSWRKSFWVWISALSFSMHGPCTSAQQMSWECGPEMPGEEPGKDCLGRCFSNSMWITVLKKILYLFQTNNYINYNKNELSRKEMKERNIHITRPNFKTIRSSKQNYCQIAIKFPKCGLSNTTLTWLWTGKNCLNSRPYLNSCPKRFEPCWVSTGALYGHGVQPSH